MSNSDISTRDVSSLNQTDSLARIASPLWLWITRVLVGLVFLGAIFAEVTLFPQQLTYYQNVTAEFSPTLATLYAVTLIGVRTFIAAIFILTGLLLYLRKPDNNMVVLSAIWLMAFGALGISFTNVVPDRMILYGEGLEFYIYMTIESLAWASLFVFFWTFPDGRIIPRLGILPLGLAMLFVLAWTQPMSSPLAPLNWPPLFFAVVALLSGLPPLLAQIYRYRHHSTPVQRQQTKWILLGYTIATFFVLLFVMVIPSAFPTTFAHGSNNYDLNYLLSDITFLIIPIALTFALMRSRLWDVDIVVNRSLVYGGVAFIGVLIFAAILLGLQLVIGQTQPLAALIISAGTSAVIYGPLRKRIQHLVDRYIYHLRFDLNELKYAQRGAVVDNPGALTGRKLGPYDVLDLVGKGGMGEVYKAANGDQIVAIKILHTDKSNDPELLQRFQREAQTGMALDHPNIANVHAIDSQDNLIYMVMDYLEGHDLSQLLRNQGKLDSETVIEIITDLTKALSVAHAQGLVHRDLKPSNVMLLPNQDQETYHAVLMDFGITKVKDAQTLTGTGAIGMIDYMAPEQIMNAREVDHRADIYSLGVMMYEILLGKRPFSGSAGQILFAHIQQPVPDPRAIDQTLQRPLAKVIMKAMEKDPDKRFQSVNELAEALQIS